MITLWEFVSSHKPLEERVCLLLDFSPASEERPTFYFCLLGKGLCTSCKIFSCWARSYCLFFMFLFLFFFFFNSQWAVLWHQAHHQCLGIQKEGTRQSCEFRACPLEAGLCRAAAASCPRSCPFPAAAGPLTVQRSWRISFHPPLPTSLCSCFGYSLPQMGLFLDVKTQFIDFLC